MYTMHTHTQLIHLSTNTMNIESYRGDNWVSFVPFAYEPLTFHTYESDLAVYVQEAPSLAICMEHIFSNETNVLSFSINQLRLFFLLLNIFIKQFK